jgi:hypothetical protein
MQLPESYEQYLSNGTTHKMIEAKLQFLWWVSLHVSHSEGVFRRFHSQFYTYFFAVMMPRKVLKICIKKHQYCPEQRRTQCSRYEAPHVSEGIASFFKCQILDISQKPQVHPLKHPGWLIPPFIKGISSRGTLEQPEQALLPLFHLKYCYWTQERFNSKTRLLFHFWLRPKE